ncbi:hypothetical protein MMC07_007546 [Pseudocyphellaria aurata]|nr:hypothetical protein [Pseudocyphellaria aurata]
MSTPPSPLFGILLPSRSVLITPTTVISPTQCAFTFPAAPTFSHLAVFLLPGVTLPLGTLAGIYIQFPQQVGGSQQFTLLGALANGKPSAIFKVGGGSGGGDEQILDGSANNGGGIGEEDEMVDVQDVIPQVPMANGSSSGPLPPQGDIIIGISIEPAAALNEQLAASRALSPSSQPSSSALVLSANRKPPSAIPTKVLAQRIIKNAFNFLASFGGSRNAASEEVVPLKSFRDWWVKFERRIEHEPGFLEREGDG